MTDRITDEPHRGAIGDLRAFQRSGFDAVRGYVRGDLPGPPVSRLVGLRPTDVGLGKVTFTMPITPWLEDGFGLYWAGVYALFADAPLSIAIWTGLPPGRVATTTELNLSFVRPMSRATTDLVGRAETVHLGGQVGLSTIQIADQHGRLLGFGSTRCLIADVPVDPDAVFDPPDTGPDDTPDPYLRDPPTEGCYFTLEEILDGVPIELMGKVISREIVFPIARTTGIVPTDRAEGRAEAVMPTSPWLSSGGPAMYGGALAWFAEFTMGSAVYTMLGPGDVFGTLDLNVRYVRPALIGSGNLTARAQVQHAGKRLRVASCEIVNDEGKRVVMATSSSLVFYGGVAALARGMVPEDIVRQDG